MKLVERRTVETNIHILRYKSSMKESTFEMIILSDNCRTTEALYSSGVITF